MSSSLVSSSQLSSIFLVSLIFSFLIVDLPTLFSPKNHDATHVATLFSIFLDVSMNSLFVSTAFNASSFLCSIQDIFNTRRQIHTSNASIFFYVTLLQCLCRTYAPCKNAKNRWHKMSSHSLSWVVYTKTKNLGSGTSRNLHYKLRALRKPPQKTQRCRV